MQTKFLRRHSKNCPKIQLSNAVRSLTSPCSFPTPSDNERNILWMQLLNLKNSRLNLEIIGISVWFLKETLDYPPYYQYLKSYPARVQQASQLRCRLFFCSYLYISNSIQFYFPSYFSHYFISAAVSLFSIIIIICLSSGSEGCNLVFYFYLNFRQQSFLFSTDFEAKS